MVELAGQTVGVQVVANQGPVPDRREPCAGAGDQEVVTRADLLQLDLDAGVAAAAARATGKADP